MTLALSGHRVVELTTGLAGPLAGRYLAEAGADVIKIESEHGGLDSFRIFSDDGDPEGSPRFLENNLGVRSVRLNLRHESGLGLARELLAESDVLLDNFRPDVLERLGLGVDTVRADNPGLVVVKMPGFGCTGPRSRQGSWGPNLLAYGGMTHLWNHPDPPEPVGTQSVFPDYVGGAFAPAVIAAALLRRRRTGEGAFLDLAQAEVMAYMLGVSALERGLTGRDPQPVGNRSSDAAPHGCYPCRGDDRWCVIAVCDDAQWRQLCHAIGRAELADDDRYDSLPKRRQRQDELDEVVADYTRTREARDVMDALQAAGVACGVVQDASDLWSDPQLSWRQATVDVTHPVVGQVRVPRLPIHLSEGGTAAPDRAPLLGEHEEAVICELLGHTKRELEDWRSDGAVG